MDATLLAGIISSAAAAAGQGTNAAVTGKMNKRSMAFSRQMYDQQKKDNLAQWERVNAYNSPAAQMQRYKEAGLNPALMYQQGSSGQALGLPTPDVQKPEFRTPEWGNAISAAGTTAANYWDFQIKQAQVDNAAQQNRIMKEQAALIASQRQGQDITNETKLFDLGLAQNYSGDMMQEKLRQLRTSTDNSIEENARRAALTASSLKEAVERMYSMQTARDGERIRQSKDQEEIKRIKLDRARMRQEIDNMEKTGRLHDLDINLKKQGIQPNDPLWSRIVGQSLQSMFDTGSDPSTGLLNWIKDAEVEKRYKKH